MNSLSLSSFPVVRNLSTRSVKRRGWLGKTGSFFHSIASSQNEPHMMPSYPILSLHMNSKSLHAGFRLPFNRSVLHTNSRTKFGRYFHTTTLSSSDNQQHPHHVASLLIDESNAILKELKNRQISGGNISSSTMTLQQINTCLTGLSKLIAKQRNLQSGKRASVFQMPIVDVARMAQEVLERMEELGETTINKSTNTHIYHPSIVTYNIVLNIWAKSNGGEISAKNAEAILDRMISRFNTHMMFHQKEFQHGNEKQDHIPQAPPPVCPNAISFHSVMDAWAKSKMRKSGLKAQEVFARMINFHEDLKAINDNMRVENVPNVRSYAIVIDAWANSGTKNAGERSSFILDEMIKQYKNLQSSEKNLIQHDKEKIEPNAVLVNSVIKAWAKSGVGGYAAQKAEEILNKMEQRMLNSSDQPSYEITDYIGYPAPTVRSYSLVLDAWAKSGEKGSEIRAESILSKMHKLYYEGYNIKPNRFSYTIVINSLARSKEKGSAQRAESVLEKMLHFYSSSDINLKPSTATFNAVIDAWARSGEKDAGQRAESILNRLDGLVDQIPGLQADTTTFNSVITAWSRCSKHHIEAVANAEGLVKRMEKLSNHSKLIAPNTITYNSLLNAYGQGKKNVSIKKAEALLEKMEILGRNGNYCKKPNLVTYTTMIEVYSKSNSKGMARNAEKIFERIGNRNRQEKGVESSMKPDIRAYSSLLGACANTRGTKQEKREALTIALRVFDLLMKESKLNEELHPNHITYRILLEVCGFLPTNKLEREKLLEESFLRCCHDGQVDSDILKTFRRAASSTLYDRLVEKKRISKIKTNHATKISNLPLEWSMNVRKSLNRRR